VKGSNGARREFTLLLRLRSYSHSVLNRVRGRPAVFAGAVLVALVGSVLSATGRAADARPEVFSFDGVQVAPSCSTLPSGSLAFEFTVVNRRPTSVGAVRVDTYFRHGARLHEVPGFHAEGVPQMHISGAHVWEAASTLNVYSGFGPQVILHEDANSGTSSYPVAFTLTVAGSRHAFPTWACAKP
jgi:hypothetical protein